MKKPTPPPIERVLLEIQKNLKHQEIDLTRMSIPELCKLIFDISQHQLSTRDIAVAVHKLTNRAPAIESVARAIQRLVMYGMIEVVGKENRLASDGVLHHTPMYRKKS